jgi:hypothetical protein
MALETRQQGNFITILQGKFAQRVQEGTEGAVKRVNKIGKTVYERFYDSFTGKLVGIKVQDGEYGKTWNFSFQDKGEVYILQLSYSNSFATAFLKMLPNIDLSKEMKVSPSVKEVDGKNRSSLFVNQGGTFVKHAYTREKPEGMPDLNKIVVKGQDVYDDTARLLFLHSMVQTIIMPRLGEQAAAAPQPAEPIAEPATPEEAQEAIDF